MENEFADREDHRGPVNLSMNMKVVFLDSLLVNVPFERVINHFRHGLKDAWTAVEKI